MSQIKFLFCFLLSIGFNFPNTNVSYTNTVATASSQSVAAAISPQKCTEFHPDYQDEIRQAFEYLEIHQPAILPIYQANPELCRKTIAVVFPELIRYHRFRDLLETEALEQLYVRYGAQTADFSIGPFQMKPSFIEKLEKSIGVKECLAEQFKDLLFSPQTPERTRRENRVQRLQKLHWQLRYAMAYVTMMEQSPPDNLLVAKTWQLHFMATAYNYGFDRPVKEIIAWQKKKAFPYGLQYPIAQFPYADLSQYFYHSNEKISQIFSS